MESNGFIHTHRCIFDSWQWSKPEWGYAWMTMLLMAEWEDKPNEGLKRSQFFSSVAQLCKKTKMSERSLRRFLHKAEKIEKDLIWERCPGGRPGAGVNAGVSGGVLSRFTIVNYDLYNKVSAGVNAGLSGSSSYRRKRKKVHTVLDKTVGENSQIYNLFIESRQNKLGMPEWLPTENQAKIMRSNIKGMLKRHPLKDIKLWISRYFDDDKQVNHKWSWTIFFSDPVRWSGDTKSTSAENMKPSDKWLIEA